MRRQQRRRLDQLEHTGGGRLDSERRLHRDDRRECGSRHHQLQR
jgi:hypothetical protein